MPNTPLASPPGADAPAPLPDTPEVTFGVDFVVIGAFAVFPLRTLLLTREDGTPLAETLSFDPATLARIGNRDEYDRPMLRVYIDDGLIHDVLGPPSPPDTSDGGMATTARQAGTSSDAGNGDAA